MEQLLLVTSCDSPAGIGASLRTHVDEGGNSGLDCKKLSCLEESINRARNSLSLFNLRVTLSNESFFSNSVIDFSISAYFALVVLIVGLCNI